jgi:hypothetical protein
MGYILHVTFVENIEMKITYRNLFLPRERVPAFASGRIALRIRSCLEEACPKPPSSMPDDITNLSN